jgi:Ca2+-binding RTX toxin-like protein
MTTNTQYSTFADYAGSNARQTLDPLTSFIAQKELEVTGLGDALINYYEHIAEFKQAQSTGDTSKAVKELKEADKFTRYIVKSYRDLSLQKQVDDFYKIAGKNFYGQPIPEIKVQKLKTYEVNAKRFEATLGILGFLTTNEGYKSMSAEKIAHSVLGNLGSLWEVAYEEKIAGAIKPKNPITDLQSSVGKGKSLNTNQLRTAFSSNKVVKGASAKGVSLASDIMDLGLTIQGEIDAATGNGGKIDDSGATRIAAKTVALTTSLASLIPNPLAAPFVVAGLVIEYSLLATSAGLDSIGKTPKEIRTNVLSAVPFVGGFLNSLVDVIEADIGGADPKMVEYLGLQALINIPILNIVLSPLAPLITAGTEADMVMDTFQEAFRELAVEKGITRWTVYPNVFEHSWNKWDGDSEGGTSGGTMMVVVNRQILSSKANYMSWNHLSPVSLSTSDKDDIFYARNSYNFNVNTQAGDDVIIIGSDVTSSQSGNTYDGGAGNDTIRFEDPLDTNPDRLLQPGAINATLGGSFTIGSFWGNDRSVRARPSDGPERSVYQKGNLRNIENIVGTSKYNDVLTGDANSNALYGMGGDDEIAGGDGNDVLAGGDGNDVLRGEGGDDVLLPGKQNTTNPRLADSLAQEVDGGADWDVMSFRDMPNPSNRLFIMAQEGYRRQWRTGTNHDIEDGTSGTYLRVSLTGIEEVWDSPHNDTLNFIPTTGKYIFKLNGGYDLLFANNSENVVDAKGGNNKIFTLGGDDTIFANPGSVVDGGSGNDTFWSQLDRAPSGQNVILYNPTRAYPLEPYQTRFFSQDFEQIADELDDNFDHQLAKKPTQTSATMVYDVETINGSKYADHISGTNGNTSYDAKIVINGLGGDDYVSGARGEEILMGGDGDDVLVDDTPSEVRNNVFIGGTGNDTIYASVQSPDIIIFEKGGWARRYLLLRQRRACLKRC